MKRVIAWAILVAGIVALVAGGVIFLPATPWKYAASVPVGMLWGAGWFRLVWLPIAKDGAA